MRHKMRERRKRFARAKKLREAWKNILCPGGLLICAPDAFDRLMPTLIAAIVRSGVTVKPSPFAPRGTVFGIAPQPPLTDLWRKEYDVEPRVKFDQRTAYYTTVLA